MGFFEYYLVGTLVDSRSSVSMIWLNFLFPFGFRNEKEFIVRREVQTLKCTLFFNYRIHVVSLTWIDFDRKTLHHGSDNDESPFPKFSSIKKEFSVKSSFSKKTILLHFIKCSFVPQAAPLMQTLPVSHTRDYQSCETNLLLHEDKVLNLIFIDSVWFGNSVSIIFTRVFDQAKLGNS